ncbi:MAG: hypothetical protein NC452_19855 [Eubacterium sp.]|nr:hypothetical protein [Eubacterium sp.]
MELKEMLREVFSEWYENGSDEKKAYKRANENFHKLLKDYELDDEKSLKRFKSNNGLGDYNFSEKHVQLLKFIKELDKKNPIYRKNTPDEKLSLKNFYIAAKKVEEIIEEDKYPEITDVLEDSLRTREFLSLYSIRDLVVKVVQLFQYACESEYADFTIYDQVNKYLDTLLYTYAGTENYNDMRQNEYKKNPNIKVIKAQVYNGKMETEPISTFNGFNSYVKSIFDTVTENKCDSKAKKIEDFQNLKYDCRYEFKNIMQVKEFLNIFYEYCSKSNFFREKYFPMMKTSYSKIANFVIALVSESFEIIDYSEKNSEIKLTEKCSTMFLKALDTISKDLLNINDDNEEFLTSIKELVIAQNKLEYNFVMTCGNGDLLRFFLRNKGVIENLIFNHQNGDNIFALNVYYCIFLDFVLYNIIYEENGEIIEKIYPTQISYKNFPITLNSLLNFKKVTDLSNEAIVDKIINSLQATEKQINLKSDSNLFSNVDNAVGIYLSELFEKENKNNKSKKKQN